MTGLLDEPAPGHTLAAGALVLAFLWHAVRGAVLGRRGRSVDGAVVAWGGAAIALWSFIPWALLATGMHAADSQWAAGIAPDVRLEGVLFLVVILMLLPKGWGVASGSAHRRRRPKRRRFGRDVAERPS